MGTEPFPFLLLFVFRRRADSFVTLEAGYSGYVKHKVFLAPASLKFLHYTTEARSQLDYALSVRTPSMKHSVPN